VLLAGLRAEELPVVRVLMDQLGWTDTRVIPVTSGMLAGSCAAALEAPEPAWGERRAMEYQGGGWGAERILLFQGLRTGKQAVLVELLEQSGLPTVGVASLTERNLSARLGDVLAEAVIQRRAVSKAVAGSVLDLVPETVRGQEVSPEPAAKQARATEPVKATSAAEDRRAAKEAPLRSERASPATEGGGAAAERAADAVEEERGPLVGEEEAQNLIDQLMREVSLSGEGAGAGLSYADLHYAGDAPVDRGALVMQRLKNALMQARRAGVNASHLKGMLREVADSEERAGKEEGAAALEPAAQAGAAAEPSDLGGTLGRAMAAGVDPSLLKGLLKDVYSRQSEAPSSPDGPGATDTRVPGSSAESASQTSHRRAELDRLQAVVRKALAAGLRPEELKGVVSGLVGGKDAAAAMLSDAILAPEDDKERMAAEGYMHRKAFRAAMLAQNEEAAASGEAPPTRATPMSKAQLRAAAAQHGLSYEELLEDARQRGIELPEE